MNIEFAQPVVALLCFNCFGKLGFLYELMCIISGTDGIPQNLSCDDQKACFNIIKYF